MAQCDFVGFFNHDDFYEDDYIEEMMFQAEEGADVVFCGWTSGNGGWGSDKPNFAGGSSTSGNYIVRTELAQRIGYPKDGAYESDGIFINALAKATDKIVFVDKVLYHHNQIGARCKP